jgi:hypothetical protein
MRELIRHTLRDYITENYNEIDIVFPNKSRNIDIAINYISDLIPKLTKDEKVVDFGDTFRYEKSPQGGGTLWVNEGVYNTIESLFALKRGVLKKLLKIIISKEFNLNITNVEKGGHWFP